MSELGIDYEFILSADDDLVKIKLLTGQFKDVIYTLGKVRFEESNDTDECFLNFQYDVLESSIDKPKKMEKDEKFKNYLGDLLVEIMGSNIEQEVIDETGTDDFKESDLQ